MQVINNSISIKCLSAIDDFQYMVTNTYTLSEFEINQIKWDRVMLVGNFEPNGSMDDLK